MSDHQRAISYQDLALRFTAFCRALDALAAREDGAADAYRSELVAPSAVAIRLASEVGAVTAAPAPLNHQKPRVDALLASLG